MGEIKQQKIYHNLKPCGLSDFATPSALKRICNSLLWLHALRFESLRKAGFYDRQPRKLLKLGFSYAGTRDEQ